jgi:hypothetical protein
MAPTLTSEAWTQIRYDYEHSERPIAEICAEHGISSGTLRDRMRRWGWTRRRPPIPREGPPPLPAPVEVRAVASVALPRPTARGCDVEAPPVLHEDLPHPAASRLLGGDPPHKGEGQGGEAGAQTVAAGETAVCASPAPPAAAGEAAAPTEIDDGALVPRLKGAVARLLPAIEATVAKLAEGAAHPREMERAGRALGALTRTLRELNALLGERQPPVPATEAGDSGRSGKPADDDDGGPRDMEEFRQELIRRMNAVVAAREENAAQDAEAGGDPGATAAGDAGERGDPLPAPGNAESGDAPQSGHARRLGPQVRSL